MTWRNMDIITMIKSEAANNNNINRINLDTNGKEPTKKNLRNENWKKKQLYR